MTVSLESQILEAAEEVQTQLDELYRRTPEPPPDSPLDQAGLRDGATIVRDYLEHGEAGLAFEHLIYMIREPDLQLSEASRHKVRKAGETLGLPH